MTPYLLKDCNMTSYLLKDSKVDETGSSQQTKLETLHGRQEQVECERRTERTKQLKRREGGRERERKIVNTNTAKTPAHKASPTPGNLVTSTKVAETSTKVLVWWCQATSCQKAIYVSGNKLPGPIVAHVYTPVGPLATKNYSMNHSWLYWLASKPTYM